MNIFNSSVGLGKSKLNITRNAKQKRGKNKKTKKSFKKMNCSPMVDETRATQNTCYTKDILFQIRDEYNKGHSNNPITAQDANDVWNELKTRLSNCDKEDCWLEEIKDSKIRKDIDDYVFSPDSPPEWNKGGDIENRWLSNFDMLNVLRQYERRFKCFKFIGPTAIDFDSKPKSYSGKCVEDELCKFSLEKMISNKKYKIGIVFNLDKHNEPGSHWVSMFIDIRNKYIFFMESQKQMNDEDVPNEIMVFKDRVIDQGKKLDNPIDFKFYTANLRHQDGDTECGMYSLYFIITMLTEKINGKHVSLEKRLNMFRNKKIPDKYIEQYRKIYFNEK
jgi:hypothetical protein